MEKINEKKIICALCFNEESPDILDENWWSDTNFIKKLEPSGVFYCISKTLIEKEALNFAQKNNLDLVCVNHAWVFGPFVTPHCPILVLRHMPMIIKGYWTIIKYDYGFIPFVHVDDVARAHIFLLECLKVKGRYICSCVELTPDELSQFLRARYPQYKIPTFDIKVPSSTLDSNTNIILEICMMEPLLVANKLGFSRNISWG